MKKSLLVFGAFIIVVGLAAQKTWAEDAAALYKKGNEYYKRYDANVEATKKELDNAIEYLNRAISINPNYGQAYFTRGHVYVGKKMYNRAIKDYTKALSIDFVAEALSSAEETKSYIYFSRGMIYILNGQKGKGDSDLLIACGMGNDAACKLSALRAK